MNRWCWLGVFELLMAAGGVADEPPPTAAPEIVRLSPTRSRLGTIEFDQATREIAIPAQVNMVKGLLEYAVVGEKGKLHESLLSTKARAFDLNVVLLLLNYKPDDQWFVPPARPKSLADAQPAARLDILVRWTEGGAEKTARLDEWITDLTTKKPAAPTSWIYTGSYLNDEKHFAAEVDGSLVALYHDSRALINSPREGADNDEQWVPAKVVPPKGTPVTVLVRPAEKSKS
ncbi:MAG: YdjY domain-containing protein [Verrucomicrobiales bacterium]